jgi:putative ABC transport system permease protein
LALFTKTAAEKELAEEIRSHLECAEEDAIGRGLTPEEARREARRLFGGIERTKEAQRDSRGVRWLETFLRDARHGITELRRTPTFALTLLSILSLGMGGTIAMFCLVDAVMLRPLPFPDPERITAIWEAPRPGVSNSTSVPEFLAWRLYGKQFEAMSAEQLTLAALNAADGPLRLPGKLVTSDYFKVFGVHTALGRTFTPDDDRPGAERVIVLSHSGWQAYFGGDPTILQHPVFLDGIRYQVIGVLQPGAFDADEIKFWRPLVFTQEDRSSEAHRLIVYGRIRRDCTLMHAREQMKAVYAALLTNSVMNENRMGTIEVQQLSFVLTGTDLRHSLEIGFGAVLVVLLITCANVANLLFARGAARKSELAVRAAVGAGRRRLMAQLLTESFVLCFFGGVGGIAVTYFLLRLAKPLLAQALPFTANVTVNWHIFLFAAGAVTVVTLIAGTLPAFEVLRSNSAEALKQSSRSSSSIHIRLRRAIVVAEVALSLVLVAAALLLVRSLHKLEQVDARVRIKHVITASLFLPEHQYSNAEKATDFYRALSDRMRAAPGLTRFGLSTFLPLQWVSNGEGIFVPGLNKPVLVRCKRVDAGYFGTLGIPVIAGRGISDTDRQGSARVMVINQALAARLSDVAHMQNPIGKVIRLTTEDYTQTQTVFADVQIVGVIRNERTTDPGMAEPPVVYVPLAQSPVLNFKLLIVSDINEASVIAGMRDVLRAVDPSLPLADVATLEQVRSETFSGVSRPAWLIGAFAVVAIVLSAIGLYGVISYAVAQQRVELAIRMALGARSLDVLRQILQSAFLMTGTGLVFGLLGVYLLTRTLRGFLFEISPLDPVSLAAGCALTIATGLTAGFFPARRAARIDPALGLRNG